MAENNSIDNLSRQDLLMVLDGFIKQTEQINEIEDKYHSRYDDIAHEVVRTEYKKEPKNLVIAYFLAPFSSRFFGWLFSLFALLADYALILLLFLPINLIIGWSSGAGVSNITVYTLNHLGLLLLWVLLGIIGYFMGRKNYMQDWVEKAIKKGTYNNEIDAAADSDPQIIDYKNKLTSLESDATYQQYRSLIPQDFPFSLIKEIYQILLDYRADNFREAVNVWLQEEHDREVKEQHDREVRQAKRQAELAKRQAELAERQAERQARKAERQARKAEREAERQARNAKAEAIASTIVDTVIDDGRFAEQRRKSAEKRRDQAIEDIADELKRIRR